MTLPALGRRLWTHLRPYRGLVLLTVGALVLMTAADLAVPLLVRAVLLRLGEAGGEGARTTVLWAAAAIAGIFLFRAACRGVKVYASHLAGHRLMSDLRVEIYRHLQRLPRAFFSESSTGSLIAQGINDVETLEDLVSHGLPDVGVTVAMLGGGMVVLIALDWRLGLALVAPLPLLGWVAIRATVRSRHAFGESREEVSRLHHRLQDNLSGMGVIQSFTREAHEEARYAAASEAYVTKILRTIWIWSVGYPVIDFLAGMGTVIAVGYGGVLVVAGSLRISDLVAFLMYLGFFYAPVQSLGALNEKLAKSAAGAERIFRLLDAAPEIVDRPGARPFATPPRRIELGDVGFAYRDGEPVLHGVSFAVEPGELVALVGPSGAGKTTITQLIPRFYDVDRGWVRVGDRDVREVTLRSLRESIAVVHQDVFLFHASIEENIALGRPGAPAAEIEAAARAANAHDFILELPDGYATAIGERGMKLSGGQKQRIAIARALLKDAPILILDEATSSVDTETEHLIQEALARLTRDRTTVVIAHRLSTVLHADRILVVERGRIVASGRHAELLARGGLYAQLHQAQFSGGGGGEVPRPIAALDSRFRGNDGAEGR